MHIPNFSPIELHEMDKVTFMNRTDHKFWMHSNQLESILNAIQDDYYLLYINHNALLPYLSTYYDTPKNKMYLMHHNGIRNRYKIRKRTYLSSDLSFLEIKFKNNKGRTFKKRIPSDDLNIAFSDSEADFIKENSPYIVTNLLPVLINKFTRLTLVSKQWNERCTIDLNLEYSINGNTNKINNLVIIEIKTDGKPKNSPLVNVLKLEGIKPSGFSKYCTGRIINDTQLKQNAFKQRLRILQKTISK